MTHPAIVSEAEWEAARDTLLVKEKEATRALDALAAERRRLPMVRIDKPYVFEGPEGRATLLDLFQGRRQLIVYHFMFAPGSEPCTGCSSFTDNIGNLAHLHARDTSLALVSRASLAEIREYQQRMGWAVPWFSSFGSDFNYDLGLSTDEGGAGGPALPGRRPEGGSPPSEQGERFGLSVFLRDGDDVYRTYFTSARGVDRLRIDFNLLDLTPLGRQEDWEDSPAGWPQTPPYQWWRKHDEYQEARS